MPGAVSIEPRHAAVGTPSVQAARSLAPGSADRQKAQPARPAAHLRHPPLPPHRRHPGGPGGRSGTGTCRPLRSTPTWSTTPSRMPSNGSEFGTVCWNRWVRCSISASGTGRAQRPETVSSLNTICAFELGSIGAFRWQMKEGMDKSLPPGADPGTSENTSYAPFLRSWTP